MAACLGTRRVCGVASGTEALWLAVRAAGLQPGDEVLPQANAFVAAVEGLHCAGVISVPGDIRLSDLGPDPDALEARLGPRSRGILLVRLPIDLDAIVAIARGRGLIVPIHRQPAWQTTFGESPPLPNAARAAAEMMSPPVHPDLPHAEAERLADTVVGFFRQGVPNRRARSFRVSRLGRVGVDKRAERLARSVAEIEGALRRAKWKIQADARERIDMLRKEANEQLAVLRGHQSEASRLLSRLATGIEGSWGDLEEAADRSLTAARTVANSLLKRLRRAARRRITHRRVSSNGG